MSAAPPQPYQWNKVSVPFTGGVDTRSDRKTVQVPKLGLLENAVFTTPNALRKRYGYAAVASVLAVDVFGNLADQTVDGARAIAARGDELVVFDGFGPLTATGGRWLRRYAPGGATAAAGGACLPAGVSMRNAPKLRQDMTLADRGTAFGVTVYAWVAETGIVYVSAVDAATGATLIPPTCLDATVASRPRIVVVGNAICLFWLREATGLLQMTVFGPEHFPNGYLSNGFSPNTPPPTYTIAADVNTGVPVYDACVAGGRIFLAYNSSTATTIKFAHVDTNGTTDGGFASQATASAVTVLGVACNVLGAFQVAIAWGMDGNNLVNARMFDVSKAALFASTTVNAANTLYKNIGLAFGSTTQVQIYFEISGTPALLQTVWVAGLRTNGSANLASVFMRHSGLAGKPFAWSETNAAFGLVGVQVLVPLVFESTLQTTYFVVTGSAGTGARAVLARMLPGVAGGLTAKAHLPQVEPLGPNKFGLTLLRRLRVGLAASSYDRQVIDCTLDLSVTGYQMATVGNVLYVAGGFLGEYDGTAAAEAGFLLYPEGVTAAQGAGGLLTLLGTVSYRVYYEYINAQGQRELSTTATSVTITLTGANQTVTLTIPTLAHSMKVIRSATVAGAVAPACVGIVVFRTLANQSLVYYRVSDPNIATVGANGFLPNDPGVDTVTFTDTLSDAVAQTHETDGLSAGLLDNVAPPPASLIAMGNARVFLSGFADDPNLIWASQYRSFGEALRWSDRLTITMPDAENGEPISAIGALGDSLIVFRGTHMYVVGGDGPDNTGRNGSFTPPRIISDDIGCPYPKSLVRTPLGLLFKSRKGIYLLGSDMSLGYIGGDVEDFNGETITSAVALTDVHEARFTTLSGKTLVFNYLAKQWSVFPNIGGTHACIWQNRHTVLVSPIGFAIAEQPGTFLDATFRGFQGNGSGVSTPQSYSWALETAWIHLGPMQEHLRLRKLMVLAEWMGQHSLHVKIAYNYELAFTDIVTVDISSVVSASKFGDDVNFGDYSATVGGTMGGNVGAAAQGLVSTQVYQFRIFPRRTRCESLKLRFEEQKRIDPAGVIDYPLLEGIRLNEIVVEVGQRGGLWQPGADRSVGG